MPFPDWFHSGQNEATFLRRLLDHVSDCLVAVDTDGKVVLINQPYCRLLGGSEDEFIGRHITDVVSPKTKLHLVAKGEMVIKGAPLEVKGHQLFTRQVPIYHDGKIIGAVGTALFTNVSSLKRAAAVAAREELSIQNSLKGWVARYSLDDIVGNSPRMELLRSRIRQAAEQSQPVLIHGESGSGKELAANAIHSLSNRSRKPFVWVNCVSIPESLIDAELFGYEGGAFTGAQPRGKVGKFELANGGTLFLDEIGDMPVHLQGSLLRAVQNQEIVRVGGTSPISIDTRIICATNRPLKEFVNLGEFRLDLYYRLNAFNIRVPALREREDLEYLVGKLLKRIVQKENRPARKMPPAMLSKFLAYSWPGNTRQLENALLRFLISGDAELDAEFDADSDIDRKNNAAGRRTSLDLEEHLGRHREAQIRRVLGITNDDKDEAARLLGISRATLYRELRRMDRGVLP